MPWRSIIAGSSDGNALRSNGHNLQRQSPPPEADAAAASTRRDHVPDNRVPKTKRLACLICRKRKLKCDGVRPSCSTCSRLGHSCTYDEQRKKSGPKRGYVKALEQRLKQVETMLKTQDGAPPTPRSATKTTNMPSLGGQKAAITTDSQTQNVGGAAAPAIGMVGDGGGATRRQQRLSRESAHSGSGASASASGTMDEFNFGSRIPMPVGDDVGGDTWEMIGLGLEEPLPPQETIDELHQIYFEKVHPSMPMIHRYRYLAAMNLVPNQRPPVCLRYAMWTMACSITDKFADLKDLFYQRARKYVEADHVKGYGEHMISVAHCQTHILLAAYETKMMYFPRAWINTGSAVRLAQMIGLHRLDGTGLDVKQCLPPPKDWTEREERRRTFWMAFCEDRYSSIGTGWPMTIDERDIMTKLPSSEEAYDMSRPEQTQTLAECTAPSGAAKLSPLGGVVLMACLFGRNLVHLHRPDEVDDLDHDLGGPFWNRHRQLESILLSTSLGLPPHLTLPAGLSNPNVIFTNMSIHASAICLHQAAISKADKNKLAASVGCESKVRCITAANGITSIMRTISQMDLSVMHPFISFCLYVAARVYVQYLKSCPDDSQAADSLRFLLSAMDALKRRNPLTESFLVQLDVDFEALVVRVPKLRRAFPRHGESPAFISTVEHAGPLCTDREGIQGILAYRDDGHSGTGPDVIEGQPARNAAGRASASASSGSGFDGQPWLPADGAMPILTRTPGSVFPQLHRASLAAAACLPPIFGERYGGSPDKQQASPEEADPTPASTGAGSDVKPQPHAAPPAFSSSALPPHEGLLHARGHMDAAGPQHPGFYPGPPGFAAMGHGLAGPGQQHGGAYAVPNPGGGWTNLHEQVQAQAHSHAQAPDMNPVVGDGVLRALMNMGPMDAVDLSSWDSGPDVGMRG